MKYRELLITRLASQLIIGSSKISVITGLYGIGKSDVARNTLNFLAERKYFRYALIWVRLDGFNKVSDLVKELFDRIVLYSLDLTEK